MQRYSFSWTTNPKRANKKTGPLPAVYCSPSTCPPSCGLAAYCYAKSGNTALHWRNVDAKGDTIGDLLPKLRKLPDGQLWRWGVAGDLPGVGDTIDFNHTHAVANATRHTRPIAYTHKPVLGDDPIATNNRDVLRSAREAGFPVNLSSDSLSEADAKADLNIGPVVVAIPEHGPYPTRTPAGRSVVVCPAVRFPGKITCESCQLCAIGTRKSIVAFPAHGVKKRALSEHLAD